MNTSPDIQDLSKALCELQAACKNPTKSKVNPGIPGGKAKYAPLEDIIEASRPLFGNYGLALLCVPAHADGRDGVRWRLTHGATGQYIEDEYIPPTEKQTMHGRLSNFTYCRRYVECGLLHIAADDDDDGNAASNAGNGRHQTAQTTNRTTAPSQSTTAKPAMQKDSDPITDEQREKLLKVRKRKGWDAILPDAMTYGAYKQMGNELNALPEAA